MHNDHYSTRIDFDLMGELAKRLEEVVRKGYVDSKAEAIRQALVEYFSKLDRIELDRVRLQTLKGKEAE
jgi:metal-responsive CopG/Arc/MetJ family transcriptional regulator